MRRIATTCGMSCTEKERVTRGDHCPIGGVQRRRASYICYVVGDQASHIDVAGVNVLRAISIGLGNAHGHVRVVAAFERAIDAQTTTGSQVDGNQPNLLADRQSMQGITSV